MNRLSNTDSLIYSIGGALGQADNYSLTDENVVINVDDYLGSEPSDSDIGGREEENSRENEHQDRMEDGSNEETEGGVSYKKLSYNDVRDHINKSYEQDIVHRYSAALDILASYVKGQKTIYMETRSHIVLMLNCLMFPALFISGLIPVIQSSVGMYIIAGLSALVTFLLAIINYCKLEGAAEAHKTSAYQYDKLQSFIEFQSGQVLLFSDPILNNENLNRYCEKEKKNIEAAYIMTKDVGEVDSGQTKKKRNEDETKKMIDIDQKRSHAENELINNMREHMVKIESDISDIKETNQFIVPQKIRYNYPLLYNTNVFSVIKKIDDYRAKTLTELKNIKNELRYITAYMKKYSNPRHASAHTSAGVSTAAAKAAHLNTAAHVEATIDILVKYKKRNNELFIQKKNTINTILFLNTAFSMMDKMFQQEILNAKLRSDHLVRFYLYDLLRCCCAVNCLLPPKYIEPEISGGDIFSNIMGFGRMNS